MEDLFSTSLAINGRTVPYHVHFDREAYIFAAQEEGAEHPRFVLRRAHDAWEGEEHLDPAVRQQAVEALDRYLLRQH